MKFWHEWSEADLIFTWLATTSDLNLELLISDFTLAYCCQGWLSPEMNGRACIYSRGAQLLGNFSKTFHPSCQTETNSSSTGITSNNAPVRRIAKARNTNPAFTGSYTKTHFGNNNVISDKLEFLEDVSQSYTLMLLMTVATTLWQEKQRTFKMISPHFQLILSNTTIYSVWFEFDARCYWKFSLPTTKWGATEAEAKLYFSSRTPYWSHCFGKTIVFGCSWQNWCWLKDCLKLTLFLFSKVSIVSH